MNKQRFRVVITDVYPTDTLEPEREVLEPLGAQVIPCRCVTEQDVIEAAQGADALLVREAKVSARVIETLDQCKVIVCCGVGTDHVDLDAATRKSIIVANEPDYCVEEVSNHVMCFLLACAKKLQRLDAVTRQGRWGYDILSPMGPIQGETLGLVAFGSIARRVAQKAQAFDLNTVGYDPYVSAEVFETWKVESVSLEELLRRSDFVSSHIPLTRETVHLFGEREFRLMKPTAYFLNTSRGKVVDEAALIRALREGWIAGAALDVLEKEPSDPGNPLFAMDNVILTPHSAYHSDVSWKRLCRLVAEDVARVFAGYWPRSLANHTIKEKLTLLDP
ncbi:MAG: C-terminal binding protein [Chloroflexi bacterium]|nr:C-terminal binding protein [Chloroflexota bacterium]